jgi:hypothetical protein
VPFKRVDEMLAITIISNPKKGNSRGGINITSAILHDTTATGAYLIS